MFIICFLENRHANVIFDVFDSLAGNKGREKQNKNALCDHSMQSSILLSFPHIFQN